MDEQQERDFYEQQKNMPRVNPNFGYNYRGIGYYYPSTSKTKKWLARVTLLILFTVLLGGIGIGTWGLLNMRSIETKEYSAPR
tara:strand:- start:137 stop:385 length:249 start_codon:yes stop_codon:yes gene_type:complete